MYGKADARRMLPELVARAREGETISIGMRGVPEAKLVSFRTPTLNDVDLAVLARGLGEAQAHRMFSRRNRDANEGDGVGGILPDNLAADVVKTLSQMPSRRDFAAEFVTSLTITTRRLYEDEDQQAPSVDRLLVGISMSAGGHPALYEQLVETVLPRVATVLHYVADSNGTHS